MRYNKQLLIKVFICWVLASLVWAVVFVLCEALLLFVFHLMSADFDISEALSVNGIAQEFIRVCPYTLVCGLLVTVGVYPSIKRARSTGVLE